MISGKTAMYGIFGHPVEHTFSPGMHNAAFRELGMNACYVPFPVRPEDLAPAVRGIIPLGLKGLNITVPHKERVIRYLDDLAEDAKLIGAVNTVEVRQGRLIGHNTDGRGFLRSMTEGTAFRMRKGRVLIVGSGGAARAVAFSLALAGAGQVLLHDLDGVKARKLAAELNRKTGTHARALEQGELSAAAQDSQCLINATPLGLGPKDQLPFPERLIMPGHLVCDLVYNPLNTRLLKASRKRGAEILSGIGMLLYQGVIAFEIWTGRTAPVQVMRRSLAQQIKDRRK